jgi:hypothetical protein
LARPTRKEKKELKMPPKIPNVVHLRMWLANVSVALVEASAYDDQAEIAWFRAVSDGSATFDDLEDSGDQRFNNLDMMLATALNAKLDQSGDLARVVKKKTLDAYSKGKLLTGRQISHLLCQHLKINDDMSLVYSINDLAALRRQGDAQGKMARFKSVWERVVDNMGPSVRIADEALRDMLTDTGLHVSLDADGAKATVWEDGDLEHIRNV